MFSRTSFTLSFSKFIFYITNMRLSHLSVNIDRGPAVCVSGILLGPRGVAGSSMKLAAGPTELSGYLFTFLLDRGAGSKGSCLTWSSDPWRPPQLKSSRSPSHPRAVAHVPSSGVPTEGDQYTIAERIRLALVLHGPPPKDFQRFCYLRPHGATRWWLSTGFSPPDDPSRFMVPVFAVGAPRGRDFHLPFSFMLSRVIPLPRLGVQGGWVAVRLHASFQHP